jgi:hypothetical protein
MIKGYRRGGFAECTAHPDCNYSTTRECERAQVRQGIVRLGGTSALHVMVLRQACRYVRQQTDDEEGVTLSFNFGVHLERGVPIAAMREA